MDSHALKVLEFGDLLARLAESAQSEPGRAQALAVLPSSDPAKSAEELATTAEAMEVLETTDPGFGTVLDIGPFLAALHAQGAVLDAGSILAIAGNQRAARAVRTELRRVSARCPRLHGLAAALESFPDWEERVEGSLSETGEVLDSASPELAAARRELRAARQAAIDRMERFSAREGVSKVLREGYLTLRNGRFVLPAKPEYAREFEGVVQDSSSSGQTLFVEPLFAVDLNNRVIRAISDEEEEVRRVLAALSDGARSIRPALAANLEVLARLDVVFARARLGRRLRGVVPILDDRVTDLKGARHPLLALRLGEDCVPIDIAVGGDAPALVVTGPNTGGKTAAIKTLGLLTLMAQAGIPVPASSGSRLRRFAKVFADIGDEQSLAQNLSTFSAHVGVIADILRQADGDTLALLDELGAGTDPAEGSALAVAVLEALHGRGACAVVTTHHTLLKEFAYRAPFARNAATEFDAESLRPTFRIRTGAPGRSHALQIASRLGIGPEVVARAREVMGSGAVRVDELLGRLSEELDRGADARAKAEEARDRLEEELSAERERRAKETEEMRRARDQVRRDAKALLRDIERRGKALLRELPRTNPQARSAFRQGLTAMENEVEGRFPAPSDRRSTGGPLSPGQEVEILSFGVAGRATAVSPDGREVEVLAGGVRLRVPRDQVEPISPRPGEKGPAVAAPVAYSGEGEVPCEVKLLGCRVEEALERVDHLIDRSLMGSGRRLRIVHGKGTGALKKAISEALAQDPRVAAFATAPIEEGGAGVTIVELKD